MDVQILTGSSLDFSMIAVVFSNAVVTYTLIYPRVSVPGNWGHNKQGTCQAGLGASVSKVRTKKKQKK